MNYIKLDEAARILAVSISTVRRLATSDPPLRTVKVGGSVRTSQQWIDDYINARVQTQPVFVPTRAERDKALFLAKWKTRHEPESTEISSQ
jgi:hypothetical protein